MANGTNKQRQLHFKRFNELKTEYEDRGWKSKHQDISEYIYPQGGRFDDVETIPNDGKRRDSLILDSTASIEHRKLTSIIYSGVTSPAVPWFRLTIDDETLKENEAVKEYFDKVTTIILSDLAKSNFYVSAKSVYAEISAFGTSAVQIEADPDTIFRFTPFTIGEYYIDTDAKGVVDTIYREFNMRARNVIRHFGEENVSDMVRDKVKNNKSGNDWIKILHVQEPNIDRDVTKLDARNKPYLSTYYEVQNKTNDEPLRVSGFDEKPFAAPRWSVTGDATWGTGPGEMALGDVKSLQALESDILEASEKDVDAAYLANGQLGDMQINSGAGGITWIDNVTTSLNDAVVPLVRPPSDISKVLLAKQDARERIRAVFFSNLLFLLTSPDNRNRTATEVLEAKREELLLLGPIMEQLHPDFLRPSVERCFGIEERLGRLPEPPEEIEDRDIKIEIISLIQLAQRLSELAPIEQMVAFTRNLAEMYPQALDKFDPDQAMDEASIALGVKFGIINSDEEVEQKRAADQAAIKAQQDAIFAQGAIDSAKTLSETDTSGDNALTALTQGGAV
jgi:hypothetical protein